ncbi:MAG: DUF5103 domain-containing protein [Bacteroidetes bacterium]|nr:DUF5103 domain-containing protein [Bacteroidota bacterium]
MRYFLILFFFGFLLKVSAQQPDYVFSASVKTPQLFLYGNQLEYPVLRLGTNDKLELHFDDIDANVKNYFYTYQLCNADWTPALISQFDYIRGFTQAQISLYRFSSVALTKYTHYQAIVPDVNCTPTRSGNYLLKVFLDADTSKLVFTKRFLVVEDGASIAAQNLQPFDPAKSYTYQKIQLTVNTGKLNITNAFQQVKVVMLQNDRWDNALYNIRPSFYSGNTFQYNNDDDCSFPGGKQWRWLDIQSFRFQSDRVLRADYLKTSTTIYVKPDQDRSRLPYLFFNDINGLFYIQTTESINPLWQTDYASVIFNFVPPDKSPFNDKDVYIVGKFTDYNYDDFSKMNFNAEKGVYETTLFLKQGYYNYDYVTIDKSDSTRKPSFEFTEGNNYETENEYTILVYYRQLGDRADKLVGLAKLNTMTR